KLNTLDIMKIPALRVEINGELIVIAGAEDLSILTGQVGFGADKDQAINVNKVMFSVMGLAVHAPQPRQLTWGNDIKLKLGDRVTFEITEIEQPSLPQAVLHTPSSSELAAAATVKKKQKRQGTP
ncbi:MAG: hypothetical protein NTY70_19375, partial [Burkholderiales bacterium]|nr:hypothetical protein [Burkholderiales bacterium]